MKEKSSPFAWIITWLVISFTGFTDAVYMTVVYLKGSLPVCTAIEGCVEVALSAYSTIGPVPVALLGAVFYTVMLVAGVSWLDTRKNEMFKYLPYLTVPAFIFSLWLAYLMLFVIEALCMYCLISALTTTLLMLLSFRLKKFS